MHTNAILHLVPFFCNLLLQTLIPPFKNAWMCWRSQKRWNFKWQYGLESIKWSSLMVYVNVCVQKLFLKKNLHRGSCRTSKVKSIQRVLKSHIRTFHGLTVMQKWFTPLPAKETNTHTHTHTHSKQTCRPQSYSLFLKGSHKWESLPAAFILKEPT